MTDINERMPDYAIDPLFLERWSPRAFREEAMPEENLFAMIDAARWAASAYNSQPWSFLYALRDQPAWQTFLDLLNPFNQAWASRASALVVVVSNSLLQPIGQDKLVPSHSHSFDTGMAVGQFILQGVRLGYHSHCMIGFDLDRAFTALNVPAGHRVEVAIAVGRRGDAAMLSDTLQQRERPSGRRPLGEIALAGGFPAAMAPSA